MGKRTSPLCGILTCLFLATAIIYTAPVRAESSFDALVQSLKDAKHQKDMPKNTDLEPIEQGSATPPEDTLVPQNLPEAPVDAIADTNTVPAPPMPEKDPNEFADIPDAYLIEADAFEKQCNTNSVLSEYYDCRCMALAYLDDRIESGPEKSQSAIIMSINNQCQDLTRAAGAAYSTCLLSGAAGLPSGISSAEEYCTCYGNTYAQLFKSSRAQPGSSVFTNLKTRAAIQCRTNAQGQTYRVPVSGN